MGKLKMVPGLFLFLAFAILVAGCASAATKAGTTQSSRVPGSLDFPLLDESVKSGFPESLNPNADFVLKTDQNQYPTDVATIPLTIENRSDRNMLTGEPYALEIHRDGAWFSVPYKKLANGVKRAWPAIAYMVPAKGQWSDSIGLSEHVPLTPGRYRLVKEIMSEERQNRQSIFISAEFNVITT